MGREKPNVQNSDRYKNFWNNIFIKYLLLLFLGLVFTNDVFADVSVTGSQSPIGVVTQGTEVTYTISVTNLFLNTPTDVGIDIALNGQPASSSLFTAAPPCAISPNGGATYDCGTLAEGASDDFIFSWTPPLGSNGEATTHDLVFTVTCGGFGVEFCQGGVVSFSTSVRPLQPGVLQFSSDSYQAAEGDTAVITINRVGGVDGELTADVLIGGGNSDTASSADYIQPANTTVVFPSNVTSQTISIPILTDALVEGDETLSLALQGNSGEIGTPSQAVLTIIDTNLPGELAFSTDNYQGTEGDSVAITVTRTGGSDGTVDADIIIGGDNDTATPTVDYTPASVANVTFGPNVTTQTVLIQLVTDVLIEGDETVSLSLSLADSSPGSIGTPAAAVLTISDQDIGEINFSTASFNASEADDEAIITVSRTGGGTVALEVDVQIGGSGDTTSSDDYTEPASTNLRWEINDPPDKTLTIPITADQIVEGDETLTLTLISVNNTPVGTTGQAVLTISDTPPEVDTVGIVSGDRQTGEVGTELNPFVIVVEDTNGNPIENATVNWEISPTDAGTLNPGTTTVTDANGNSSNTLTLNTDEQVIVTARVIDETVDPINFVINSRLITETGLTENQRSIVEVLNTACQALAESETELTAAQQDLLATCTRLETTDNFAEELDLLIPDEVSSQGTAVIKAANLQVMNVNSRLNALRSGERGLSLSGLGISVQGVTLPGVVLNQLANNQMTGGAAGEELPYSPWGAFVNGNISFGSKDRTNNENGFDFDTLGITAGIDYRLSKDLVVGAALGYGTNESDFDSSTGDMDMDGWHITGYGTWYKNQQIYLDGVIKLGFNSFNTTRRVSPTGTILQNALGSTDGNEISLSFGGGYEFVRKAMSIGGYGRIGYSKAEIDAYSETAQDPNAPGIGSMLNITDQDVDSLTTTLGSQWSYTISTKRGVIIPQARLEWEHEFSDDKRDISARFLADPTSTTFNIQTDDPDRDYFNLGLGFSALTPGGKSGFLYYETRLDQDNIEQHWIKGGFRFEF